MELRVLPCLELIVQLLLVLRKLNLDLVVVVLKVIIAVSYLLLLLCGHGSVRSSALLTQCLLEGLTDFGERPVEVGVLLED